MNKENLFKKEIYSFKLVFACPWIRDAHGNALYYLLDSKEQVLQASSVCCQTCELPFYKFHAAAYFKTTPFFQWNKLFYLLCIMLYLKRINYIYIYNVYERAGSKI